MRRPRPAWYQATATCTSPWKKSRSGCGAARQAVSSSSCAAKYSRARMSFRPCLYADSNFSVFHLDVVRLQLDREVELVLPGADVVLPAVPRAGEDAAVELAVAERPLQVEAMRLDGIETAVAVRERELLLAGLDGANGARRDVLDPSDGDEIHRATLATAPSAAVRSHRGDDPA